MVPRQSAGLPARCQPATHTCVPVRSVRSFNLRRNLLRPPLSPAVTASSDMIGDTVKAQIIINKAFASKVRSAALRAG